MARQIGERLRELRLARALTQAELGTKAGYSAETISKIESGYREPRPTTVRALADALSVEVEDLTGGVATRR